MTKSKVVRSGRARQKIGTCTRRLAYLGVGVLVICGLAGCSVGVQEQRFVSRPNMQFSRSAVYNYSSKLVPQIQPGLATSAGAQPSTCTLCQ